jgi:hypothetical protein
VLDTLASIETQERKKKGGEGEKTVSFAAKSIQGKSLY